MDIDAITDPEAPELFPAAFPQRRIPPLRLDRAAHGPPRRGVDHRDDPPRRPAGRPAPDGRGGRAPSTTCMCAFTGDSGAMRQAEFFVYRPADRRMLEAALERHRGGAPVEPTTWIRATRRDAELVRSIGVRETGMLASASDYHTFHKFRPGGRRQAASTYLDAVRAVLDAGLRPRLHLEDATRAPEEFVLPFAEAVMAAAAATVRRWRRSSACATRWASACRSTRWPRRARCRAGSAGSAAARHRVRGPRVPPPQRHPPRRGQLPRRDPGGLRRRQRHPARHRGAHRQRPARGGAAARHRHGADARPAPGLHGAQRDGPRAGGAGTTAGRDVSAVRSGRPPDAGRASTPTG